MHTRSDTMKKTSYFGDQGTPENPVEKQIEVHFEDIQSPYKFTDLEIGGMNLRLREQLNNIDRLRDQKAASMKDFALRIQNAENETKMIRDRLDTGEETRAIRAIVEFESPRSKKRYLHPDTKEFIREEPMQPADWQLPMFAVEEVVNEATGAKPLVTAEVAKPTVTDPEVADFRSLIDRAKKEYPDKDKLSITFLALRERHPNQYPGKEEVGYKIFLADIKECVESEPETHQEERGQGQTSVGDALNKAAAATEAPLMVLDLGLSDWTTAGLSRAFKKAAKAVGWTEAQIGVVTSLLRDCDTVEKMIETLRPFVVGTVPEKQDEPEAPETPNADAGINYVKEDTFLK